MDSLIKISFEFTFPTEILLFILMVCYNNVPIVHLGRKHVEPFINHA